MFEVTQDSFEKDVLQSDTPVVVDFWAPWCGPCRAVEPILQQLEGEHRGKIAFAKLNIDEHPELAVRFDVLAIPTTILFDGGEAKEIVVGARPHRHYQEKFSPYVK